MDLRRVLSYVITTYSLSLLLNGSILKTNKAALLRKLDSFQTELISQPEFPSSYTKVNDGGLVLHSLLSQKHVGASYGSIAGSILSLLCSGRGTEFHICLDKYVENSIKYSERKLRGAVDNLHIISGREQTMRQSGQKLLTNGIFKNELGNSSYVNGVRTITVTSSKARHC